MAEQTAVKKQTKKTAQMFTLGNAKFHTERVGYFFEELRALGMEGKWAIPRDDHVRQYVICGIFSHEELDSINGSNDEIRSFKKYLLENDDQNNMILCKKFICRKRLAVLLNNLGTHGEARLFDPDCVIRQAEGIRQEGNDVYEQRHLDKMKDRFRHEFGPKEPYYIVLFSHLIPCTVEGHECARLVRSYVERSGEFIIVSYDNIWHETNKQAALSYLTHDNIKLISPKERIPLVNKVISRKFFKTEASTSGLKREISQEDDYEPEYTEYDEACHNSPKHPKRKRDEKGPRPGQPGRDGKKKKRGGFNRQIPDKNL